MYWKNDCPSSPRYCRPISIIFEKESGALILRGKSSIDQQIRNIEGTSVMIGSEEIKIHHIFILSMIDGCATR